MEPPPFRLPLRPQQRRPVLPVEFTRLLCYNRLLI